VRKKYAGSYNFAGCELKLAESEKVLGALIRSLRSPNRLQV